MKKTTANYPLAILIAAVSILFMVSCSNNNNPEPEVVVPPPVDCNCESSWFPHDQTPAPAEGIGSPFDTSSTTNCIFHQWSMQKFLWVTKPIQNGKALFEDSLILVDNNMIPVPASNGVPLVVDDITQAGSRGILISNPGFSSSGKSDTVYYSIYINSTLQKAADSMKNLLLKDTSLRNNQFTFPVGSLELKVSWININSLPAGEVKNYYTSQAVIKSTGKKVTVALLGMHVVGVVINHPEFIWATFEHRSMAPEYDWKNTSNQDVPVTSNDEKLFFKKGDTATWANLQWNPSVPAKARNVFSVYPYGVPRIAMDSFMTASQAEPINYNNIQGLNTCEAANIKDVWQNYFYNGSLWINTDGLTPQQQADTIAALGNSLGNATPGSVARGSVAAYNITMETFVQVDTTMHNMMVNNLTNCLSCHSGAATIKLANTTFPASKSPLYVSHIFRSYLSKSSGVSTDKIETLRILEFMQLLKTKKE
jgi:hypothetical protein